MNGSGFANLKNYRSRIRFPKFWNRSGGGFWKCDSGHLWLSRKFHYRNQTIILILCWSNFVSKINIQIQSWFEKVASIL